MRVQINGVVQDLEQGETIAQVLSRFKLNSQQVVVEKNGDLFKHPEFDIVLQPDDVLEIVHFMGGGSC